MICFAKYIYAEMFPDMMILECKDCGIKHKCNLQAKDESIFTKADRIRCMSDDELAEFISGISACSGCKAKMTGKSAPCKGLYEGCKGNWANWLKEEG